MNDKKHIDRLFQEKFKDFEVAPDDSVWENIHEALHKEKRNRRVIPFWWQSSGVAALLLLCFGLGFYFFKNNESSRDIKTVEKEEIHKSPATQSPNTIIKEDINVVASQNSQDMDSTKKENNIQNLINNGKNEASSQVVQNKPTQNKNTIDNSEKSSINQYSKNDIQKYEVAKNTSNPSKSIIENSSDNQKDRSPVVDSNASSIQTNIAQNVNASVETINPSDAVKVDLNDNSETIEDAIVKAEELNEDKKDPSLNRWNISPNVAPVYFNSLGKGSSISGQFINNGQNKDINMSYGISGSYAINDKIKIRAGINKVDLGYSTAGVVAFNEVNSFNNHRGDAQLKNINFKGNKSEDAFLNMSTINSSAAPQFLVASSKGSLEQQFGYIEVPLEMEYNLIDNKFGLNLIGGFSTLFLNNNEIYSVVDHQRSLIGEANNMNATSYSANLGLGVNYNISQQFKLNLEPIFKYQINTFSNTSGDFRPYFIGVYTGLSFKF